MSDVFYRLSSGVVVREESFGLLFYDSKNTNLSLINSGRLISGQSLDKETDEADFLGSNEEENLKIQRLLEKLVNKGLLYAKKRSV